MMNKNLILTLMFCAFLVAPSSAQDSSAENTKELIAEIVSTLAATPKNEARLKELLKHPDDGVSNSAQMRLAGMYWNSGRIDEAEQMLTDMLNAVDRLSPKYLAELYMTWSMFEDRRNNYFEAEGFARQALEIAKASHPPSIAAAHQLIGASLRKQNKLIEAKSHLEQAANQFKKDNNLRGAANSYNSIGLMYSASGDASNAIRYLLEARKALENVDDPGLKAALSYNLGDIFLDSGEPDKALKYYENSLESDTELGDLYNIAFDYTGIANALLAMGQTTEALLNNQRAIQKLLQIDAPRHLSRAYVQQSRIYTDKDESDNVIRSLLLARESALKSGHSRQQMMVSRAIGKYHLGQQNLEEAKEEFIQALEIAEQLSLENEKLTTSELLGTTYAGLKDYKKAHSFVKQSLTLQQKLNTEDQRDKTEQYKRDLNLMEEQLKVSQLEQTKTEQQQQLQLQETAQQRLYLAILIIVLLFTAGLYILWQRRKLSVLRVKLYEEALKQKQQLFADVSHELRTPLTALKLQVDALQANLVDDVQGGYQKLNTKVGEINRLITDIYQLAQADSLSLDLDVQPCDLTEAFEYWQQDWQSNIQNAGFDWYCNLDLNDGKVEMDADKIKQVIDNLLSNSTFYTDKPGSISLTAKFANKRLIVAVEDSAPSVDKDKLQKIFSRLYRVESSRSRQTGGSGLGLAICESIIKAHNGNIKASQSSQGGLKVEFYI